MTLLYKNSENLTNEELLKNAVSEEDNTGQIVLYTGLFRWNNGTIHNCPDPDRVNEDL